MSFFKTLFVIFGVAAVAAAAGEDTGRPPVPDIGPLRERPMLLGVHRGGRAQWPENTVLAFREVARRWPNALLEMDVLTTADGHVVVLHDEQVDRTTNGSGMVAEMTLAEIQALDAAWHFTRDAGETYPYRGQGIVIPTLTEVLEAAPNHPFLIEMKTGKGIARATGEAIRKAGAEDRCIIATFRPAFMREFKETAPEIATSYDFVGAMQMLNTLRGENWDNYTPEHAMLALSPELKQRARVTPEDIARIREKGILVAYFTVNDAEEMQRLIEIGADSIITDRPMLLAEVLAEAGMEEFCVEE